MAQLSRSLSHYTASSRCSNQLCYRPRHRKASVAFASRQSNSTTTTQQQDQGQQDQGQQDQQARVLSAAPAVLPTAAAVAALLASACIQPDAASALTIHTEPANALSLPTWAIHVSSVTEWAVAMALMWRYAEVSGNPRWKGMTWGMMPCLGSAMAACTWHFFYNSPDLDFLVALQAGLTVIGNFTCWIAAYRIYTAAQAEQPSG